MSTPFTLLFLTDLYCFHCEQQRAYPGAGGMNTSQFIGDRKVVGTVAWFRDIWDLFPEAVDGLLSLLVPLMTTWILIFTRISSCPRGITNIPRRGTRRLLEVISAENMCVDSCLLLPYHIYSHWLNTFCLSGGFC